MRRHRWTTAVWEASFSRHINTFLLKGRVCAPKPVPDHSNESFLYVYIVCYRMTTVVLDADSLIKLTKAEAKEEIVQNFEAVIPNGVKIECVDEASGKPDAAVIQQNIAGGKVVVVQARTDNSGVEKEIYELQLRGGEQDVYRLSKQLKHSIISSDDQKFLRLLHRVGADAVTPATLVVLLYKNKRIGRERASRLLAHLRPYVSAAEYDLCTASIGGEEQW